ncbi:MAG: right-handed parallel beta-helix repeat-containing protein [Deltaproteobacteria bacterium]|nr:right-handed parallel beta-helix repeat-containing protein [Deltaproteobacteria bacterium]
MRNGLIQYLILVASILWGFMCSSQHFEAISSQVGQTETPDTSRKEDTDTEEEQARNIAVPSDARFDAAGPSLDEFRELSLSVVGNGTLESCNDASLRAAMDEINLRGEGQIEFRCGEDFQRIEIEEPLSVESNVRLWIHGTLSNTRKPMVALDGREENHIWDMKAGSQVAFDRLTFANGRNRKKRNGGAIFASGLPESTDGASGGHLIISECVFLNNKASSELGGAVYADHLDNVRVYRSVFEENWGGYGGAMYLNETGFDIVNSDFVANSVKSEGGALWIQNTLTLNGKHLSLTGVRFDGNRSTESGSAMAVRQHDNADLVLTECELSQNKIEPQPENTRTGEGTLYIRGGRLELRSCSFLNNLAVNGVGAVYVQSSRGLVAENCTFYKNTTQKGQSGALYQNDANASEIVNSTFYRNQGGKVGAIYRSNPLALTIRNTIFYENMSGGNTPQSCNAEFQETDVSLLGDTDTGATEIVESSNLEYANRTYPLNQYCTAKILTKDPDLHDKAETNNGFVSTIRLNRDSYARNRGRNCPLTDARGKLRSEDASDTNADTNQDATCDAGAYEFVENGSI